MTTCRLRSRKAKIGLQTMNAATSDNNECNCPWQRCAPHSTFTKDSRMYKICLIGNTFTKLKVLKWPKEMYSPKASVNQKIQSY